MKYQRLYIVIRPDGLVYVVSANNENAAIACLNDGVKYQAGNKSSYQIEHIGKSKRTRDLPPRIFGVLVCHLEYS